MPRPPELQTYLLDTDVCVEILRGNRLVVARRARTIGRFTTSWMTAAELQYGAAKSRNPEHNRAKLAELLGGLGILPATPESCLVFGEIKARLERHGHRLPDADLLIAATAIAHDAILLTGNVRHFSRIPEVRWEDWIHGDDWALSDSVHQDVAPYDP